MEKLNLDILSKLGKLTRETRKEVFEMVEEGMDITEIIDFVEKKIFTLGYLPAFPCTVSVNDVAAHYTVYDEGYKLKYGDVIKVDFGFSHKGFITDNAFTIEIGSNDHFKLLNTAKACLDIAMDTIDYGIAMSTVGKEVERVAKEAGFNTIRNLSGHQIGRYNLHCGLSVPNYENKDLRVVEENMEFAIEPFVTYGAPKVKDAGGGNILHLLRYKPVRDPIAMKVLKHIRENFSKLPFSKRWLVDEILANNLEAKAPFSGFDKRKVDHAIRVLKMSGVLHEYAALSTVDGRLVAQFEDAVVFVDGRKVIITRLII